MSSDQNIVIVGAGHAAGQLVTSLRQRGSKAAITVIGDEPYLPYQRPPLSKKFLAGEMPAERLYVKPATFYESADVDLKLGQRVVDLQRDSRQVITDDGATLPYDQLVLATGSRVRQVVVPGSDLAGIHYLRSIADVDAIRHSFTSARRIVVVGAGYIGLEVTAVARQSGLDVTVLEMADRVMSRVVSPAVSAFYEREHREQGVNLLLNTGLAAFEGSTQVSSVLTADGRSLPADAVIVGIGIEPVTELAESAGLAIDNGIVVDERCVTSDASVYAIGDCTAHPSRVYDCRLRLESVHNALEQAKTAAINLTGGTGTYDEVPWFWSDQYDLKLQIAGLSAGYDEVVVRGDPNERAFACAYLREGRIIAVDAVNSPRDFLQSKALIAAGAHPDPERLARADLALKEV